MEEYVEIIHYYNKLDDNAVEEFINSDYVKDGTVIERKPNEVRIVI